MHNEYKDKRARNYFTMRSLLDYTMGVLYLAGAAFLIFAEKLGVTLDFDMTFRYVFGGICAVYGAWRIYRGYKKEFY